MHVYPLLPDRSKSAFPSQTSKLAESNLIVFLIGLISDTHHPTTPLDLTQLPAMPSQTGTESGPGSRIGRDVPDLQVCFRAGGGEGEWGFGVGAPAGGEDFALGRQRFPSLNRFAILSLF
jgi:hypothetical protein